MKIVVSSLVLQITIRTFSKMTSQVTQPSTSRAISRVNRSLPQQSLTATKFHKITPQEGQSFIRQVIKHHEFISEEVLTLNILQCEQPKSGHSKIRMSHYTSDLWCTLLPHPMHFPHFLPALTSKVHWRLKWLQRLGCKKSCMMSA